MDKKMVISDGIPTVPRILKLSEFRSKAFRVRVKCSEFLTVKQKYNKNVEILFRSISGKRKQIGIPFHGTKIEANFSNRKQKPFRSILWNFFGTKFRCQPWSEYRGGGGGYVGPIYCHDLLSNVYSFSFSSENNSVQLHFFPSWNKISKKSKNRKEPIRWKCPEFSGNIMPAFQYIKSTFQLILFLRNLSFW